MASADLIRESQDPSTSAARLAELSQIDRGLWPAIAVHPAAYPALLDWLGQQGDPTVNAVLALRSGASAAVPPPPPAPVEQTQPIQATYAPPAPTAPLEPTSEAAGNSKNKNYWLLGGVAAVALILIGGAAFGATKIFGGDDDNDETSSSQTIDAPESGDAPTVGIPETGSDDSSDSTADAFCSKFKEAQTALLGDSSASPGSDTVKTMADIFGDLEDVAPAEVKSEMGVMADYFEAMSDPSTLDTSTISERIKEFTTAGEAVSTYYASHCM